jgi:AcrR family transcriptional regulator
MDPEADRAIVAAAIKAMTTVGFQGMTIEGVAADAGVAKTTVYRRYASTLDLVRAALATLNRTEPDLDTGSARTDLETLLTLVRERFDLSITGTLLVEESRHPELLDSFREAMIGPAIGRFKTALRRGVDRGELRADLDVDLTAHAVLGSFFTHYFERGRPGADWPTRVVANLWPGLAA